MKTTFTGSVVVAVCLSAIPNTVAAPLLTNGGLEKVPDDVRETVTVPVGSSYAGWESVGGNDIEFTTVFSPTAEGVSAVDLNGIGYEGAIAQAVTTKKAFAYTLRFAMSGNPGRRWLGEAHLGPKTMVVLWNSTNVGSFTFTQQDGDSWTNMRWEYHEIEVVGSGQDELRFESTTSAYMDAGPVVDDVSLDEKGVSLPSGCVGWWRAEDNAVDSVLANDGTLRGEATYADGKVGRAFSLDGLNDGIFIGNPAVLQLQEFTVETWIKRRDTDFATLGQPFTAGGLCQFGWDGWGFAIFDDGHLLLSLVGRSSVASDRAIQDTNWHHVAVCRTNDQVGFYIDGVGEAPKSYPATFTFVSPGFQIGAGAVNTEADGSFFGLIDELSVYNRALLPAEIAGIHAAGSAGKSLPESPRIVVQPASQEVVAGTEVTFTVTAAGTAPLAYAWTFQGTNLVDATNAALVLPAVQAENAGVYAVVVSDGAGRMVTSEAAVLTVHDPPVIVRQPEGARVLVQGSVTFSVEASGPASESLSYQWLRNGVAISGAISPTLILNNVGLSAAGTYTVRVSTPYATVVSDPATLIVASGAFTSAEWTVEGIKLTVAGEANTTYLIEVSTNLTDWQPLATLFNNPMNWSYVDTSAVVPGGRYYRLRRSP